MSTVAAGWEHGGLVSTVAAGWEHGGLETMTAAGWDMMQCLHCCIATQWLQTTCEDVKRLEVIFIRAAQGCECGYD